MSGTQESTSCPSRGPPLAPLSFNPLRQIECSEAGCAKHYPARFALLCFDFSLRLEAIGCSVVSAPNPKSLLALQVVVAVISQYEEKNFRFCIMTRKGPRPVRGRGGRAWCSPTTQIAQKNPSAGERSERGSASHTPPTSTGFFKAR